jgi:GDP-4-dehydro-6-deoxy-D-mannose reductase
MRYVVTGAQGFLGSHLTRLLQSLGHEVAEFNRVNSNGYFQDLSLEKFSDVGGISHKIAEFDPDVIFHLAAQTSISDSWKSPFEFISSNILINETLSSSIADSGFEGRLIILSSSAIYRDSEKPIAENFPLLPNSPYAVAKLATETLLLRHSNSLIIRPFFIVGLSKKGDIFDDWSSQILEILKGSQSGILKVGNIDLYRDYIEVEKAAAALIRIAEHGESGAVYNLCSGAVTSLKSACETLMELSGCEIQLVQDSQYKAIGVPKRIVIGDPGKVNQLGVDLKWDMPSFLGKKLQV